MSRTMICWQHLKQRHNLFIDDSNITQRVGRRDVPIGKGLFTVYDEENPNAITDEEYNQKYSVFTAPFAVGVMECCCIS